MRAIEATVRLPIDAAEEVVRAALSEEGFGVLTEIDVAATLKARLGVEREPLKILGACNPSFADRALSIDPSVSLVLPCNVVLSATSGDSTRVAIADPRELMTDPAMAELATEAAERLQAVAAVIAAAG